MFGNGDDQRMQGKDRKASNSNSFYLNTVNSNPKQPKQFVVFASISD